MSLGTDELEPGTGARAVVASRCAPTGPELGTVVPLATMCPARGRTGAAPFIGEMLPAASPAVTKQADVGQSTEADPGTESGLGPNPDS